MRRCYFYRIIFFNDRYQLCTFSSGRNLTGIASRFIGLIGFGSGIVMLIKDYPA